MNQDIKADHFLDIRWLPCPFNHLKVMMTLQGMKMGAILEVLLEYNDSFNRIVSALRQKGYCVVRTQRSAQIGGMRLGCRIWVHNNRNPVK